MHEPHSTLMIHTKPKAQQLRWWHYVGFLQWRTANVCRQLTTGELIPPPHRREWPFSDQGCISRSVGPSKMAARVQ
ncbi:hypothetical protein Y1Q_0022599 [Alligator mississippiensis]|uniref:Uncharacterized protein n=1 Tax=Alligator mississippiensis TaxID=8496 RepID=A0A151NQB4_ALLMI|nr:hypothetical protein Y1Q_0022599 [Alligator mississippiensis]